MVTGADSSILSIGGAGPLPEGMKYQVIVVPERATIPEELDIPLYSGDLIEKLAKAADKEVAIVVDNVELQLLVREWPLLKIRLRALIGLTGVNYSTTWNSLSGGIRRETVDSLLAERKHTADQASVLGQERLFTPESRRSTLRRDPAPRLSSSDDPAEEGDVG